jgi:hypothetical protein
VARRTILILTAMVAFGAAGCGAQTADDSSDDFRGDERLVAQAVEDLQSAAQRGEGEQLCTQVLARVLVQRFEQAGDGTCADAVTDAVRDADTLETTVEDVTVTGQNATARVQADAGARDETSTLELVREGDRWKISALPAPG